MTSATSLCAAKFPRCSPRMSTLNLSSGSSLDRNEQLIFRYLHVRIVGQKIKICDVSTSSVWSGFLHYHIRTSCLWSSYLFFHPKCQVPFLNIDLKALSAQLSRLRLSQRLFIEADLLPEELVSLLFIYNFTNLLYLILSGLYPTNIIYTLGFVSFYILEMLCLWKNSKLVSSNWRQQQGFGLVKNKIKFYLAILITSGADS